jgi:hypothetical protein
MSVLKAQISNRVKEEIANLSKKQSEEAKIKKEINRI